MNHYEPTTSRECFYDQNCPGDCIRLRRYLSEIGATAADPAIRELARAALVGETLEVLA